jgi:hypothetical protein
MSFRAASPLGVLLVLIAFACPAGSGPVYISELLGSTAAEDTEFIELHNPGSKEIDLTGWTIELWDSDEGAVFGTPDGDSPIRLRGKIDAGGYFLLANPEFVTVYGIEPDMPIRPNAIENSSYTIVLKDGHGEILETIFVSDGDENDTPNIAGREITPDAVIRADGRFIPPGFARVPTGDGTREYRLLEFSPRPTPSATPGRANRADRPREERPKD